MTGTGPGRSEVEAEPKRILRQIFILLDHLERQSDNRLEAQFDKSAVGPRQRAVPPAESYAAFLTRLSEIDSNLRTGKSDGQSGGKQGNPPLDDISFLRWSRDFLAAVAAPATVESIEITRKYIQERASFALSGWFGWRTWLRRWSGRIDVLDGVGSSVPTTPDEIDSTRSARWLARSVRRLEFGVVIAAITAVMLSAYAMVGRSIIIDRREDLGKLQVASREIEQAAIPHLGAGRVFVEDSIALQACSPLSYPSGHAGLQLLIPNSGPSHASIRVSPPNSGPGDNSIQAVPIIDGEPSSVAVVDQRDTADPKAPLLRTLVSECNKWRWALMQLVSENIRLKSWDWLFVNEYAGYLIGWNHNRVEEYGETVSRDMCGIIERSYLQVEPAGNGSHCPKIFRSLVIDSASTAESILSLITQAILPVLYAFLGTAMATFFTFGRKIDTAVLAYTDRALPLSNGILGIIFGAIIGLFASYLEQKPENGGLQLSAIALLAGLNAPAVFGFLTDLSNRVFGGTSVAKKS